MNRRILVVEDEATCAEIIKLILTQVGYELTIVTDGKAAYTAALSFKPDLVLMDVNMPGFGGFETCKIFKSDRALAHIPIIFVTASLKELDQAFEVGGADFVNKPIQPIELKKRISFHLERADFIKSVELLNHQYLQEIEQQRSNLMAAYRKLEKAEHDLAQLKRS